VVEGGGGLWRVEDCGGWWRGVVSCEGLLRVVVDCGRVAKGC
jgi:hypothetical protein